MLSTFPNDPTEEVLTLHFCVANGGSETLSHTVHKRQFDNTNFSLSDSNSLIHFSAVGLTKK